MPALPTDLQDDLSTAALPGDLALLNTALAHLPTGLCMFDADDRLLLANAHYLRVWGLPPELGQPGVRFADIMAATQGREVDTDPALAAKGQALGTRYREWMMGDGRRIRVAITRLPDGRCVALHEDITAQVTADGRADYLARHDALTGLPNRSALRAELQAIMGTVSAQRPLALLFVDLGHVKAVNDRLGQAGGDDLLRQVARRLRACTRENDHVFRLGGDEFAVMQTGPGQPDGARTLANRLICELSGGFDLYNGRANISASVGVAVAPPDGQAPDVLLKNADLARAQAKTQGHGQICFFEPGMEAKVATTRALAADLHQALPRGELELAYQVQVNLETMQANGVEALLRWNHSERGRVPPDTFIPLAEQEGLIPAIGRWVLMQACHDAARWPEHIQVAVNVSPVQFQSSTLVGDVTAALNSSGLAPGRLEIEITESVMLQGSESVLQQMHALRGLGVRVAMDDFGTGYSSLASLRSFPFDRIKIDRSFVRELETSVDDLAIVRAVAGLGHSLGIATTVEGVETKAQLDAVVREGCNAVQGYLFSQPGPAADVLGHIERLSMQAVGREMATP